MISIIDLHCVLHRKTKKRIRRGRYAIFVTVKVNNNHLLALPGLLLHWLLRDCQTIKDSLT